MKNRGIRPGLRLVTPTLARRLRWSFFHSACNPPASLGREEHRRAGDLELARQYMRALMEPSSDLQIPMSHRDPLGNGLLELHRALPCTAEHRGMDLHSLEATETDEALTPAAHGQVLAGSRLKHPRLAATDGALHRRGLPCQSNSATVTTSISVAPNSAPKMNAMMAFMISASLLCGSPGPALSRARG